VDRQTLHDPARVDGRAERAELARPEHVGEIDELEQDASVGAIDAVAVDRLAMGDARERSRQVEPGDRAAGRSHGLEHLEHLLDGRERELEVDLRELELAIGALVLVAEAARDLEVAVEARDHQELLHDLRRLWQRVERSGLEPARHQEIARALGRALGEDRRLDLEEALRAKRRAHRLRELVAQTQRALQRRAAQVVHAVLEARRLVGVGLRLDRERRRRRAVEDSQLVREHLDLAGRQLRIHRLGRAALHAPAHEDHVLRAQGPGLLVALGRRVGLEHDLHEPFAVAQVDEDHAAVVAAALHPAPQHDRLADALRGDFARAMGAAQTGLGIEAAGHRGHAVPPLPRTRRVSDGSEIAARALAKQRKAAGPAIAGPAALRGQC
jgi:hypothetical protein